MIYSTVITIPKNTPATAKQEHILKITSGLIWLTEIYYPPGCCGLARCQIFDGAYQLFPCNIGGYLAGEADTLTFEDLYFKTNDPYELLIKTWNIDDTWEHTISIRIGLAMTKAEMSRYIPGLAFEELATALNSMVESQEMVKHEQLIQALEDLTAK